MQVSREAHAISVRDRREVQPRLRMLVRRHARTDTRATHTARQPAPCLVRAAVFNCEFGRGHLSLSRCSKNTGWHGCCVRGSVATHVTRNRVIVRHGSPFLHLHLPRWTQRGSPTLGTGGCRPRHTTPNHPCNCKCKATRAPIFGATRSLAHITWAIASPHTLPFPQSVPYCRHSVGPRVRGLLGAAARQLLCGRATAPRPR